MSLKTAILKITPPFVLALYHRSLAELGALWYGFPSEKLTVIGVTGTSGKSTTVFILHSLLEGVGSAVGSLSTIAFKIGEWSKMNDRKMTMLGRFKTQQFLRRMVKANCQYAIIETTSQGIDQSRHRGIHYDLLLCTNLYPEHIEAHGGFENYKKAKLKLFDHLAAGKKKKLGEREIPRRIVVNADDEHAHDFLDFSVEEKYAFTLHDKNLPAVTLLHAQNLETTPRGMKFTLDGHAFESPLRGEHNVRNVVAALTIARALGISWEALQGAVRNLPPVPGRLEYINEGQPWDIVVDYAFEPGAMGNLYATLRPLQYKKIIQVLGGTGGGRDKARRPVLGKMAAEFADYVIVTNEDPYDEDPEEIINQVEVGVLEGGKKDGRDLFVIKDRREAIHKALTLAESGGLVLITGKGCEQAIVGPNGSFSLWDDREVVRDELKRIRAAKT
ncbi:MAG: UDP-N-acetylmuramoyl-L-alanyl-D-glutamate--2,6-diaminopimelate ligase [Patescibacteria group bacterium]